MAFTNHCFSIAEKPQSRVSILSLYSHSKPQSLPSYCFVRLKLCLPDRSTPAMLQLSNKTANKTSLPHVPVQKWAERRPAKNKTPTSINSLSPAQVLRASKLQEIARKQSFLRTHPSFHSLPEDILKKFVDNAVIKDYKPAEV